MNPNPGDRQRKLRRLDYATRSKPAEKRPPGAPNGLVQGSHSRGYLPHVKAPGASYFVTFRLGDSLPQTVLAEFQRKAEADARAAKSEPPNQVIFYPSRLKPISMLATARAGCVARKSRASWRTRCGSLMASGITSMHGS